jgi:exodeoxyribonuclease V gamma subunit
LLLADETASIDDEELFLPDHLAPIKLAQRLLPRMLAGASANETRQLAAAGLEYPSGQMGALLMESELASMASFASALQAKMCGPVQPPVSSTLPLQIDGEEWVFEGALADVRENGLVRYRYANATVADYLTAWISHLFLCSCAGVTPRTEWLSRDEGFAFKPVENPAIILHQLLTLYRRGLQAPLHFFPKSAWEAIKKKNPAAARSKWTTGKFPGEEQDPAYQLALRGDADPLNAEFDQLTQTVLGTMEQHIEKEAS